MRTKLQFYLLSLAMIVQISTSAQNEMLSHQAWLDFKETSVPKECQMSVFAMNVSNKEVVLEDWADENFIPASTMKVITCAAALEKLGADFVWQTHFYFHHENEILNMQVDCSGDPSFGSKVFADRNTPEKVVTAIVQALQKDGLTTSWQGDVILYPNEFVQDWLPGSTAWEDVANYYGGSAGAFQFCDNEYSLQFSSDEVGEKVEILKTTPHLPSLEFFNEVIASKSSKDQAYIYGLPESKERFVKGEIPHSQSSFSIRGGLPSGKLLFESLLREALNEAGVKWHGQVRWKEKSDPSPLEKDLKMIFVSPQLSSIVQHTLNTSDNLYANAILLTLGAVMRNEGSFESGTAVLSDHVKSIPAQNTPQPRIQDGSGLSRSNGVSAKSLSLVLAAASDTNKQILMKGMRTSSQDTALHYKSGYLDGVRCYAGYYDRGDELFAYAIMANGVSGSSSAMSRKMRAFISGVMNTR